MLNFNKIEFNFEVKDLVLFLLFIFEFKDFFIGGKIVWEFGEENLWRFCVELWFLFLGFFNDFKSFFGGVLFLFIYGGIDVFDDIVGFVFDKVEGFIFCWVFGRWVFFFCFKGFLYLLILILICFLFIIFILKKGWLFCLNGVRLVILDVFNYIGFFL